MWFKQVVAGRSTVLGEEHPDTLAALEALARTHERDGAFEEAVSTFTRLIQAHEQVYGPDDEETFQSVTRLGNILADQGKLADAHRLFLRALEGNIRAYGDDDSDTFVALNNLAWCALELADAKAAAWFTQLLPGWSDPTDWKHHWVRLGLALCDALESGDLAAAEAVIRDLVELVGAEHDRVKKGHEKVAIVRALREPS